MVIKKYSDIIIKEVVEIEKYKNTTIDDITIDNTTIDDTTIDDKQL